MSNVKAFLESEELPKHFMDEHLKYSKDEWRQEVQEENTILGYWMWVQSQIEQEE